MGNPTDNPWARLPLRHSFYQDSPCDVGSAIVTRQPLSNAIEPGLYKYVIDEGGEMWVGVDKPSTPNHSSLVGKGAPVRAAGNIRITSNGVVHLNTFSGHYMVEVPFNDFEERVFIELIRQQIEAAGFECGQISGDTSPLPKPKRGGT